MPLRVLPTFALYVPYFRALSAHLMRFFYAPCASNLCTYLSHLYALKSLQDGFVVHQKFSIFQGLLKALQTVLFLCESKKNFLRGKFF